METEYKYWRIEYNTEKFIINLLFDNKDKNENTINKYCLLELDNILETFLSLDKLEKCLIISSAKCNFCLGTDIKEISAIKDESMAKDFFSLGHKVLNKLNSLPIVTIALVNGQCLGSGLELILACDYVLALNDAIFSIPEIKLGLYPYFGGSIRLSNKIGIIKAIQYILTTKNICTNKAKNFHLINEIIQPWQINNAIKQYSLLKKPIKIDKYYKFFNLYNFKFIRKIIVKYFIYKLEKNNILEENYPAPYMYLNNFIKYGIYHEKSFQQEINGLASLIQHNSTKNLLRVFCLSQKLKTTMIME